MLPLHPFSKSSILLWIKRHFFSPHSSPPNNHSLPPLLLPSLSFFPFHLSLHLSHRNQAFLKDCHHDKANS
ncbi:hypothetical protein VNO80_21973 [Phaseolus coccineus]|uniref:Uncharacterized protein n=1 Tax=Phaseolus coccineus TaxID=3886 RepID=A0AAN9M8Y2_PHACN